MPDAMTMKLIRDLESRIAELEHLRTFEVVPPLRKDEQAGVGISLSIEDRTDLDRIVKIVDGTPHNGYYDAVIESRLQSTWEDTISVWAIDLSGSSSLTADAQYITNVVRMARLDANGDPVMIDDVVTEAGGPYFFAIDAGYHHALTDTAWWRPTVSDPLAVLPFVEYIVAQIDIANGAQTIVANSSPTDFAAIIHVEIKDSDGSITAGTVAIVGTDVTGAPISENVILSTHAGTTTYPTTSSFKTVTSVTVSGLVGAAAGDKINVHISDYPIGVLRQLGGFIYLVLTPTPGESTAPVPPDWAYFASGIANKGAFYSEQNYALGDYVQEVRALYTFNSTVAGGTTPTIVTSPSTGTATGPAFTFTAGSNMTVTASGSNVTFVAAGAASGSIVTSPSTGTATGPNYTFAMGTSGTDLNWSAGTSTVTLNVPDASTTARGVVTTSIQTWFGGKTISFDGNTDETYFAVIGQRGSISIKGSEVGVSEESGFLYFENSYFTSPGNGGVSTDLILLAFGVSSSYLDLPVTYFMLRDDAAVGSLGGFSVEDYVGSGFTDSAPTADFTIPASIGGTVAISVTDTTGVVANDWYYCYNSSGQDVFGKVTVVTNSTTFTLELHLIGGTSVGGGTFTTPGSGWFTRRYFGANSSGSSTGGMLFRGGIYYGGTLSISSVSGTLPLANGGLGVALADPGANKILAWDDTDNTVGFWTLGTGLSYDHSTHTISATGGGVGSFTAIDDHKATGANFSTSETILYADPIDGSLYISGNGDKTDDPYYISLVRVAGGTVQIRVYFGPNGNNTDMAVFDSGALTLLASGGARLDVFTIRTASGTVQVCVTLWISSTVYATGIFVSEPVSVTGLTLSSPQYITITGQSGGAGGSGDITATIGYVASIKAV